MDFIERIFGFSPDDGSGLFELLLFAIPLLGLTALYLRNKYLKKPGRAPRKPDL